MIIITGTINVGKKSETLEKLNDIAEENNSTIVLFDAKVIAGKKHIEEAVRHAKRSFEDGTAIARTLAMEILVYASGQRQCSIASKIGLHDGENIVYALVDGGNESKSLNTIKTLIAETPQPKPDIPALMKQFDITQEELDVVGEDRIEELAIERVAMIDAWK